MSDATLAEAVREIAERYGDRWALAEDAIRKHIRALGSCCTDAIAVLERIAHSYSEIPYVEGETIPGTDKPTNRLLARAFLSWAGPVVTAESCARCLELEAALEKVGRFASIHSGSDGSDVLLRALHRIAEEAEATLTPTVETLSEEGKREHQGRRPASDRLASQPSSESAPALTGLSQTDLVMERFIDRATAPEPLSEGVTEPASSGSGGQARVVEPVKCGICGHYWSSHFRAGACPTEEEEQA